MSLTAGLGSFDPNTLPMDAFELSGSAASIERYISLKAPWMFGQRKKLLDATTYTVEAGVTYILVTIPDAVTITIPEGLPLLRDLTIARSVASTDAVTVVPSGSETIEGATSFVTHGAFVVAFMNDAEVTLRKKASTDWRFVSGSIRGSISGKGEYQKFSDGIMRQWYYTTKAMNITTSLSGHYYAGDTWNLPVAFSGNYSERATYDSSGNVIKSSGTQSIRSLSAAAFYAEANTAVASSTVHCSYEAIGPWK